MASFNFATFAAVFIYIVVAFIIQPCAAVYQDEAFLTDWQIPSFGSGSTISKIADDYYIMGSEDGILSVLSTCDLDGDQIIWRQALEGKIASIEVDSNVLITGSLDKISFWNISNGLYYDSEIFVESNIVDLVKVKLGKVFLLETSGKLSSIDTKSSLISSVLKLEISETIETVISQVLGNGNIFYVLNNKILVLVNVLENKATYVNNVSLGDKIVKIHGSKVFYLENEILNIVEAKNILNLAKSDLKVMKTNFLNEEYKLVDFNTKNKILTGCYVETIDENQSVVFTENAINVLDSELNIIQHLFPLEKHENFCSDIKNVHVKLKENTLKTIIEYKDGKIELLSNGKLIWEFETSLSQIEYYFVHTPIEDNSQIEEIHNYLQTSNIWEAYKIRVKDHYLMLKDTLLNFKFYLEFPIKQEFGWDKKLILITKNNLIFNFELDNGFLNWKSDALLKNIDNAHVTGFYDKNSILEIFLSDGSVLEVDISTGYLILKNINQIVENTKIQRISEGTIVYNFNDKINFFPLANTTSENFYFVENNSRGVYGLEYSNKGLDTNWKYELEGSESIILFSENIKNPNSMLPIGVPLGDKSVLYKYLNPNIYAFIIKDDVFQKWKVIILDTIIGKIIKQVDMIEKIDFDSLQLVQNDNYIIYSYFSYESLKTKIEVIEFYESKTSDIKNKFQQNSSSVLSASFATVEPYVKSKSYNIPFKIDKLILSNTKYDITTKTLILKLETGQIIMIPKYFASARRIEGRELTSIEKQEYNNIPYKSELPIFPKNIITHERQIILPQTLSEQHMFSVSTNLESTSIICYFNNDIFCTKIYPSAQFDMLSSEFSKWKLLSTVFGLVAIHYIVKRIVKTKKINSFWVDSY